MALTNLPIPQVESELGTHRRLAAHNSRQKRTIQSARRWRYRRLRQPVLNMTSPRPCLCLACRDFVNVLDDGSFVSYATVSSSIRLIPPPTLIQYGDPCCPQLALPSSGSTSNHGSATVSTHIPLAPALPPPSVRSLALLPPGTHWHFLQRSLSSPRVPVLFGPCGCVFDGH